MPRLDIWLALLLAAIFTPALFAIAIAIAEYF